MGGHPRDFRLDLSLQTTETTISMRTRSSICNEHTTTWSALYTVVIALHVLSVSSCTMQFRDGHA